MTDPRHEKFLTVKEVAAVLRVHQTTVYRLLKRGRIPCFRVGSDWRVSWAHLETMMREQAEAMRRPRKPKK